MTLYLPRTEMQFARTDIERARAVAYKFPEPEPIAWRRDVETVTSFGRKFHTISVADISLSRVRWLEVTP